MRILAIEPDIEVRELYKSFLSKRRHQVEALANITYEYDVNNYDVVIVHSEEAKHYLLNVRYDHVIVASCTPTAKHDGSWAISKPFHMEELDEVLEVIAHKELRKCTWKGDTFQ